jgi:hypothetical protein
MKRLALALMLAMAPAAYAQPPQPTSPAPLTGYATLSVLLVSIPLSGAVVGPNSPAFPTSGLPGKFINVLNATGSANPLFVCPLGGTCTTAVGIPIAAGVERSWMLTTTANGQLVSPTVISAGSDG